MWALAADAAALLARRWGTGAIAPPALRAAMACVELPADAAAAARRARLREAAAQQTGQREEGRKLGGVQEQARQAQQRQADQIETGTSGGGTGAVTPCSEDASWIQNHLHFRRAIEVPIKLLGGRLYVRISAHVYNELGDYERLADAVLALADNEV
jgi:hypothetical protein